MYLYVLKWDVNPKKNELYEDWALKAIRRSLSVPGVAEVRAFRPIAGQSQVVVTFQFADFESWSSWFNDDEIQKLFNELFALAVNVQRELWEPSPLMPEPVRAASNTLEE